MMGGQPEAVIADDKVHITLIDQILQSWQARADEARREEIEQARAAERHRINQTLRKIVVKPNHCLGIPPLTLARAQDMLHSHFSQVAEVGYMQQHVNGVPVLGVNTHSIAAWVGPPLGGGHAVPQLLRDSEVLYAKWEYYFAVPDPEFQTPAAGATRPGPPAPSRRTGADAPPIFISSASARGSTPSPQTPHPPPAAKLASAMPSPRVTSSTPPRL